MDKIFTFSHSIFVSISPNMFKVLNVKIVVWSSHILSFCGKIGFYVEKLVTPCLNPSYIIYLIRLCIFLVGSKTRLPQIV